MLAVAAGLSPGLSFGGSRQAHFSEPIMTLVGRLLILNGHRNADRKLVVAANDFLEGLKGRQELSEEHFGPILHSLVAMPRDNPLRIRKLAALFYVMQRDYGVTEGNLALKFHQEPGLFRQAEERSQLHLRRMARELCAIAENSSVERVLGTDLDDSRLRTALGQLGYFFSDFLVTPDGKRDRLLEVNKAYNDILDREAQASINHSGGIRDEILAELRRHSLADPFGGATRELDEPLATEPRDLEVPRDAQIKALRAMPDIQASLPVAADPEALFAVAYAAGLYRETLIAGVILPARLANAPFPADVLAANTLGTFRLYFASSEQETQSFLASQPNPLAWAVLPATKIGWRGRLRFRHRFEPRNPAKMASQLLKSSAAIKTPRTPAPTPTPTPAPAPAVGPLPFWDQFLGGRTFEAFLGAVGASAGYAAVFGQRILQPFLAPLPSLPLPHSEIWSQAAIKISALAALPGLGDLGLLMGQSIFAGIAGAWIFSRYIPRASPKARQYPMAYALGLSAAVLSSMAAGLLVSSLATVMLGFAFRDNILQWLKLKSAGVNKAKLLVGSGWLATLGGLAWAAHQAGWTSAALLFIAEHSLGLAGFLAVMSFGAILWKLLSPKTVSGADICIWLAILIVLSLILMPLVFIGGTGGVL